MTYLTAIAIGPVQDFIAAARRCRDLWYGSHLLSEVSKATARELQRQGGTLVFPAPEEPDRDLADDSDFTVANKLLVRIESDDISAAVDRGRQAARSRLRCKANLTEMKLRGLAVDEETYWGQLDDLIEFYAAWTPLKNDYPGARARVEELLAARKTLRNFDFYKGSEGKWKSSLDGAREHVIQKRSKRLYESNLKDNEYLDAIGIVKRFGGGSSRFESTVDVAAVPFVKGVRISSAKRQTAFQDYLRFLRDHGLPPETYSLLYEHESRQIFEKEEAANEELTKIRAALGKPKPPYYALFLGDGDRMGRAISRIGMEDAHRRLSQALSGFAGQARRVIDEEYDGCPIYCGGDDVLALLPLDTAVGCANAVRELFRTRLKAYDVTFSAGLVIAHGLEQLSEVRAWAAAAEHTAKSEGGRDALCISAHPRSGPPITVHGKWDDMLRILDRIGSLESGVPQGFGHEMRDIAERLKGWENLDSVVPKLVLSAARKKECEDHLVGLVDSEARDRPAVERLYRLLMVARWFGRAKEEAKGDGGNNHH